MADRFVATSAAPGADVDGLGGGGSLTTSDLNDAGAVGVGLVQSATLAAALGALGGVSVVRAALLGPFSDAMSGAGWPAVTATGGATATWADNKLSLHCDPSEAGSCGVTKSAALPSRDSYDVAIRVQVIDGDGSSQTRIILACGQSANDCAQIILFTDGSIETGITAGGSYGYWSIHSTLAALSDAVRTGGALWLRVHRAPGLVEFSWGIGVGGALPTVWHAAYSSIEKEVAGYYNQAQVGLLASNGPFVGIFVVTLTGIELDVSIPTIVTGLPGAFGGT